MNSYTKFYIFIVTFFTTAIYSQNIDPSLINNLSDAQIKIVEEELLKRSSGGNSSLNAPIVNESTKKGLANDLNLSKGKKYGYDYFSSIPTNISAVGDLPLPNDYKISLKDQFTIILSGSKEAIFDIEVKLDGTILFPELGSVTVVGETFEDVKSKLRNLINQSYVGVNIDISLKNLAAKKVTIVGAVKTPGTYLVNPFSTISSVLAYSGGISEIGTLRDIKLIRVDGKVYNFDLYKLLIDGDRSDDITIQAGDVILINAAKHFITISGSIKRPAIYEINNSETLGDLIEFSLGFNPRANLENMSLSLLDKETSKIIQKNTSDLNLLLSDSNYEILNVTVYNFVSKNESSVFISGAVREPGFYELLESNKLEDIIDKLEFIDVYPWAAVIEQFDENELIKSSTLFSLNDKSTYQNIDILPNSKIFFASVYDRSFNGLNSISRNLINDFSLRISHKNSNYELPVYGKFKVDSFIDLLGLDMSDVNEIANYISPLDSLVINENYKMMEFNAKKYNRVSFRSPVNDLITVTISGAVDYPGKYTLNSDSTLNDLYELIGKFKKEAFLNGVIFTRQSVRERQLESIQRSRKSLNEALIVAQQKGQNIGDISIIKSLSEEIEPKNLGRIAGDYSPDSISSLNTILLEGDSIIIPKNPNVINVFGEVLNPTSFEYSKGISVRRAIERAGGFKDFAKRSNVYVIKANGIIEPVKRNIFIKNTKLEPGDTIVVPRKIITNNQGLEILIPITQVLSDLAFSAAALETLSNSN